MVSEGINTRWGRWVSAFVQNARHRFLTNAACPVRMNIVLNAAPRCCGSALTTISFGRTNARQNSLLEIAT